MINTSTSDENLCGLKRADFQTTVRRETNRPLHSERMKTELK